MKNSKNNTKATYTIDFTNSKIIATASFMEKAGQYGSQEYHTIMRLRKDLPEFEIELLEEKNSSKKKGCLNLDTMEAYIIRICGDKSDEIKEFYKVREEYYLLINSCVGGGSGLVTELYPTLATSWTV